MQRRRRWLAGLTVVALATASVVFGVAPAANAAAFSMSKTAVEAGPFSPGDSVTYQISVACSAPTEAGCFNTVLSDPLPDPLIFNPAIPNPVTVSIAPPAGQPAGEYDLQVDAAANSFTVTPGLDVDVDPVVWPGGYTMTVTVNAIVDPATDGTWDGATVTNTATTTGDNAPVVTASADIILDVETTLVPSIVKTVSPTSTIPAVAGQPVDWTVVPGNNSNQNVDTIVVQDPITPPSEFGGYLDVTGYDVTAPTGTTSTTTEYYVDGAWTTTVPDPISDSGGIRVTFTGTFAPGATGNVVVHTVTNETVADIPDDTDVTVTNDAQSTVATGGETSDPVPDDASITIAQRLPDVTVEKSFADSSLTSGQSTTATITSTVGAQNVQTLTVTEPSAGTATFTEQGLTFDGFGDGIAWPVAATSAEITYTYSDCAESTASTTTPDTLPAPTDGCTVEGFTVVYSSTGNGIVAGAYTTIPLDVTALPTETAVSGTNVVDTAVENTQGQIGVDDAEAAFTIEPLFLDTSVTKSIAPDTIWGVPGTDADITLTGNVTPESNAGSERLVISDPVDPTAESEFWDNFTATEIDNTDIPECTTLTVRYWDEPDGPWTDFPGATEVPGPEQLWSYQIPTELQDDIGGIQFEYLPLEADGCPELLQPGFTVVTHIDVEVTDPRDEEVTFTNTVQSLVDNPDAGGEHTADASDDINLLPIDGGPGPDFLDKEWTPDDDVPAQSGEVRTARLWWSTDGLNISEMTLTDISETEDPQNTVASVYDAFDLVRIDPITPDTDPLIVNDIITEVSLYLDGEGWTDITAQACANGCEGEFGGYTLSDTQSADALAVRIVLTERTAGAGVGSSYDRRPLDLDFRVRDTLRSDPSQWVLGDLHTYTYNTGEPGLVDNTASAHGVNTATGVDSVDVDNDTILIVDEPINAALTKEFDQDQLGLPDAAAGVDPGDYPLISATLVATNTSSSRVSGMVIDEPSATQPDPTVFETLNLYDIDAIQRPQGISEAQTTITLDRDGATTGYTYAEALALAPGDLADVTGVSVAFRSGDGSAVIASTATGSLTLTWQLRDMLRSDPSQPVTVTPDGESIVNDAHTQLESPVLDECADNQCGTGAADASDEFVIVAASYAIETTKSITPASIYEDQSTTYVTALGGRPDGTARTTFFSLTDTTPTFWNTMDYAGAQITVPSPVNQVAMDVLVDDDAGSDVVYTEVGGTLIATCNGLPITDDSPCWADGEWTDAAAGSTVTFDLPDGVTDEGTVVGVRFRAQQVDAEGDVVQWERPFNPQLTFSLTTERREFLRSDPTVLVSTTRPDLQPNPGETELGVISDDVQSFSTAQFGEDQTFEQSGEAADSTVVLHRPNAVKVTKTRGSSTLISPSGTIPYVITVQNTGQWNMTGFHVVDQVETDAEGSLLVEPDPAAYTFALTGSGAPADPGFTASLDETTGELSIDGPADFVFNAGWTLTVNAPLMFRAGVTPDTTVSNEVTVTSDRLFETCEGTTVVNGVDLTPKPVENTPPGVAACSADTEITPLASATIAAKKYVQGNNAGDPAVPGDDDLGVLNVEGDAAACDPSVPGVTDDGFYSYPCAPVTRPGGEETWRIDFTNAGNTSARVLAAVDTLPEVGDQGVIVPADRESEFPVTLSGTFSANLPELVDSEYASYSVYLSPVQLTQACNTNAIKVWTENASADPTCNFDWELASPATPPATLQAARSMMMVLEYENPDVLSPPPGLRPGETLRLTYETQTPFVLPANSAVPDGLPVAYNSFATASRSNATVTQPERPSLVVEPQKVGVAAATGQLLLAKDVEAPDFATDVDLPESYPLLVTCTSGGEAVTLLHEDGSDASRPSVAADGTVLAYNSTTGGPVNLPLFSTCTVVEDPVIPGVTVTVDPEDGVIADRDWSEEPSVWDPYSGDPEQSSIQVTNQYAAGGFTVEKSVDNGGAVNQDDIPIVYDRTYSFEASCTYLDQETIPEVDLEFTLADGESKTFSDIPAGAECTVTETDAGGAPVTTVVVTEDGVAGDPATSTEASFTILPYAEGSTTALTLVGFENAFTTGPVEVTKVIVDPGGWGTADFTVEMSCTLDGVTPNPVFEDSATLNATNTTWLVEDLPTGAECTVTETADGGANSSTPSVTVTVGDDPQVPVEATITNTFTIGSLEVQKRLEGAPADALDPATTYEYEVSLACTRVVNGETVDVAVPGGATRTITGAGTALYEGLPTGAECTVTETDAGFATGTPTIDPTPVIIGEGATPVVVTVTNEFENGAVSVAKTVDAPDGFPVPDSFTATVSCTWQGADVPLADDGAVTIVPGEDPVVIPDVPVGSICTVAEDDFGQTGTTVTPESITVTAADQTFGFQVENTYEWASLEVGKLVESAAPEVPTGFEFHVVCTFQGETVVDETFTLNQDETETITEIPARSECTVTETDEREADATVTGADVPGVGGDLAPIIDQETRTVVIPELQPDSTAEVNTVTYTNLYDATALVLVKEFEGAGADEFGLDQTFTFTVTCTFAGETLIDQQVELNAENGWSTPVHDVVAGSECTVVENDLNGADAVVIEPNDGENTSIGTGIVPPGGGLVTVTATNWYLTGSLEVTKTFAGEGADKFGGSAFELSLRCVRDGEVVDIPDGRIRVVSADVPTALWENLPTGSQCLLTEVDDGGANSTEILDAQGNVVAGDGEGYTFTVVTDPTILSVEDQPQPSLEVRNTFNFAQVSVSKAVDDSGAVDQNGEPIAYGPFEVELSCLWNQQQVSAAEAMTQTIADGETVTWTELPEDAECTVTETDDAGAQSTTIVVTEGGDTADPQTATTTPLAPLPNTDAADQTSVAITNTFGVSDLGIAKVVDGTAASTVTRTFPVDVTCVLIDASHPAPGLIVHDASYDIGGPGGLTADIENLPAGSECTVTETNTGDADRTTMTIDGEEQPGTTGTVTLASGQVAIVFTNTFIAPLPPTGLEARATVIALALGFLVIAGGVVLVIGAMRRRRQLG